MKMPVISLLEWQKKFGTERACSQTLAKISWLQGFQCPSWGFQKYSFVASRKLYQCSRCH
ncbi:MAG TPA: IS1595 family transposase, partial [Thermodesulfobacteriaceae bacterium]|nr:IS1595 family transposase [Thermodesulfobacteriaceae bacterium]